MVDAERPVFRESASDRVVDLAARFEIAAERFFQRHPDRWTSQPSAFQPVDGRLEQRWGGRQEDRDAVARVANRFREPFKPRRVVDVESNVMKPLEEALGNRLVERIFREMLFDRRERPLPEARIVELGPGRADDP